MKESVSFPLAKLLNQKGFKEECIGYWGYDSYFKEWSITYPQTKFKQWYRGEILAPTIGDIVSWLYKKHKLWLEVYMDDDGTFGYAVSQTVSEGLSMSPLVRGFVEPEEAYEKGIEYCINEKMQRDEK